MQHLSPVTKMPILAQNDPSVSEKLLAVQVLLEAVSGIIDAVAQVFVAKEAIDGSLK